MFLVRCTGLPSTNPIHSKALLSEKLSSQSAAQACSVARPAQQKQRKAEEAEACGKAVHREIEEVSGEEASPAREVCLLKDVERTDAGLLEKSARAVMRDGAVLPHTDGDFN